MVSGTNPSDTFSNVIQGKVGSGYNLPKYPWAQIKILLICNKDEFDDERHMLLTETLPKLQQYFLAQGLYVLFNDINLNWHFDFAQNPYHVLRLMKEIQDCYHTSSGLFLLTFVGNKYGNLVLPVELSTTDFNNIKNLAIDLGKDFKLLENWYILDDKVSPSIYKLKNPDDEYNHILCSVNDNQEWQNVYTSLIEIFTQILYEMPPKDVKEKINTKTKQEINSLQDIQLLSGVETLFNFGLKQSTSGCMCIIRQFDGLTEKNKGCEVYLDIINNKIDKIRQDKLKKFRDMINTKLDDENRQLLNLNWKDNGFQIDDSEHQRYLRTLNAAIFLRIKVIVDDYLSSTTTTVFIPDLKFHEYLLYDETLTHLYHYQSYVNQTYLGFDSLLEKIKRITLNANKNEHYPLMILGTRASGKTLLCTKIVQNILSQLGGSKNVYLIVRYYNLTNSSRNINELLLSICSQLN
ncbi:unnamed protein product, partial [Didymodactylos carnosus]